MRIHRSCVFADAYDQLAQAPNDAWRASFSVKLINEAG